MPQIFKVLAAMVAAAKLASGDPNFKVLDIIAGSDAELNATGVHLIDSNEKWQRLWTAVEGDAVLSVGPAKSMTSSTIRPIPQIDFEKNVVLGVFGGALPNVTGYQVIDANGMEEKAYIRIRPVFRQSNNSVLVHNPYLLMLLPRTKKEIELRMQVPSPATRPDFRLLKTLPKTSRDEAAEKKKS